MFSYSSGFSVPPCLCTVLQLRPISCQAHPENREAAKVKQNSFQNDQESRARVITDRRLLFFSVLLPEVRTVIRAGHADIVFSDLLFDYPVVIAPGRDGDRQPNEIIPAYFVFILSALLFPDMGVLFQAGIVNRDM